jgi:crotonobetainyl-CoA:carnitine CoA-transferase CaiB-like acyl-CoA transferase
MKPLSGITVLDLTRLLPGAVATMMLGDFGADVIKIEEPGTGDPARHSRAGIRRQASGGPAPTSLSPIATNAA